jgi:hypothetical protein
VPRGEWSDNENICHADAIAKCIVIITDGTADELGPDSFRREKLVVNRIRNAVDREEIVFHPAASHPAKRQELMIDASLIPAKTTPPADLRQFVAGKLYWLAFMRGAVRIRMKQPPHARGAFERALSLL